MKPVIDVARRLAGRAWRLTFAPSLEWRALGQEPVVMGELLAYLLALALMPALAWSLGRHGAWGVLRWGFPFLLCIGSVVLLAAAYWLVIPMYSRPRSWPGALAVAVYSATPVLLAGVALVLPQLVLVTFIAAVHSLVLQYQGTQDVLGVKRGDAAEVVAVAGVLLIAASMACGAVLARLNVLPI